MFQHRLRSADEEPWRSNSDERVIEGGESVAPLCGAVALGDPFSFVSVPCPCNTCAVMSEADTRERTTLEKSVTVSRLKEISRLVV